MRCRRAEARGPIRSQEERQERRLLPEHSPRRSVDAISHNRPVPQGQYAAAPSAGPLRNAIGRTVSPTVAPFIMRVSTDEPTLRELRPTALLGSQPFARPVLRRR